MEISYLKKLAKEKKIKNFKVIHKVYRKNKVQDLNYVLDNLKIKKVMNMVILDWHHYFAIKIRDNKLFYFCSCDCVIPRFLKEWADNNDLYIINDSIEIQSNSSYKCGFFCVDYLMNDDRLKWMAKYNLKNLKLNDNIVVNYIKPDPQYEKQWNGVT